MYKEIIEQNNEKLNQIKAEVLDLPDFVDTTDGTATAEDIRKDMTAYVNGEKITGTLEVVEPQTGDYYVKVFDYDGTLLDEKWLNSGDTYTLPEPPSHERFEFEGWTCTRPVNEDNATITIDDDDVLVGAVYHTKSGACELDVTMNTLTGGLTFTFTKNPENCESIDWGDGSITTDTYTHTYSSAGNYTIKLFGDITFPTGVIGSNNTYNLSVRGIYMSNSNITIKSDAFRYVTYWANAVYSNTTKSEGYIRSVRCKIFISPQTAEEGFRVANSCWTETVIFNYTYKTLQGILTFAGSHGYKFKNFVIPSEATVMYSLNLPHNFEKIRIPKKVTTFQSSAYYSKKIVILGKPTIINSTFGLANLECEYIKLPSTITSILANQLTHYQLKYLDCRDIVNPFAVASDVKSYSPDTKVVVADENYDNWVANGNQTYLVPYVVKYSDIAEDMAKYEYK